MRFVEEIVVVGRSPADVFSYVSDFDRAREWREDVVESTMQPAAPMRVGARLTEVAQVAGRRVVTQSVIDECVVPDRWHFRHETGPLPVSGEFAFTTQPDGAVHVRYILDVELPGLWRLAAPYLRRSGRRTIHRSMDRLRVLLEAGTAAT